MKLEWWSRHGIKVGRVRRLIIGGEVLGRREDVREIIQTLRVGKDTRGSVATGREVPTRDEPSNLWRRKVVGIAAR